MWERIYSLEAEGLTGCVILSESLNLSLSFLILKWGGGRFTGLLRVLNEDAAGRGAQNLACRELRVHAGRTFSPLKELRTKGPHFEGGRVSTGVHAPKEPGVQSCPRAPDITGEMFSSA